MYRGTTKDKNGDCLLSVPS